MATSDIHGDIQQTRRRQAVALPVGIGLTPEQQKAQADAEWRRGAQQRTAAFKRNIGEATGGMGDALSQVVRTATTTVGAGLNSLRNTTFDSSLPDYRTPEQKALAAEKAQQYGPQQQAGAIAAYDIAQRAVGAAQQPFSAGIAGDLLTVNKPPRSQAVASSGAAQQDAAAPTVEASQVAQGGGVGGQGEQGNGWSRTGVSGVAGRLGASGVPEFTNAADAVRGAGPQRAIGRVGDGIGGGLSVGAAGDSQLAIDRFERANAERAKAISMLKQFEPSGIAGNRGPMTLDEVLRARLGLRQRDADLADRELRQRGIEAGMDRNLRERELSAAEQRNYLESQRTLQEIEAGNMTIAQQRRVEDLSARIADPATDAAERESLLRTYSSLTGKKLDSGTIKLKRASADPTTGAKTEEEYLADARTGRPLADLGGPGSLAPRTSVSRAEVEQTARNRGMTAEQVIEQLKSRGVSVNG